MERNTTMQSYYSPLTPEWEVYRTVDNHSVTAPLKDLIPIMSYERFFHFLMNCLKYGNMMRLLKNTSPGSFRECHAN